MKIDVDLCMGSSCFARGNNRILSLLEQNLEKDEWKRDVKITGHLCMGNCSNGPVVRINGEDYLNRSERQIADIIGKILYEQ